MIYKRKSASDAKNNKSKINIYFLFYIHIKHFELQTIYETRLI